MTNVTMIQGIEDGFLGAEGWEEIDPFYGYVDGNTDNVIIIDSNGVVYFECNKTTQKTESWAIWAKKTVEESQKIVDFLNNNDIAEFIKTLKLVGEYQNN